MQAMYVDKSELTVKKTPVLCCCVGLQIKLITQKAQSLGFHQMLQWKICPYMDLASLTINSWGDGIYLHRIKHA